GGGHDCEPFCLCLISQRITSRSCFLKAGSLRFFLSWTLQRSRLAQHSEVSFSLRSAGNFPVLGSSYCTISQAPFSHIPLPSPRRLCPTYQFLPAKNSLVLSPSRQSERTGRSPKYTRRCRPREAICKQHRQTSL